MARGKRTLNRMDMREDYDNAEAAEVVEEVEEESSDAKTPAKKKAAPKKKTTTRKKTAKVPPRRAVWVIFDNSNKPVERFEFKQKDEAEAALEKRNSEKKTVHFLQMVKEEMSISE